MIRGVFGIEWLRGGVWMYAERREMNIDTALRHWRWWASAYDDVPVRLVDANGTVIASVTP